jgi:hypothetical protein
VELAHRWGDRNLSRMELVLALLVLALLLGMFSKYMFSMFAKAELSMMNRTVININTALNYRSSMALMKNNFDELELMQYLNPMEDMQAESKYKNITDDINNYKLAFVGSSISSPLNYGGVIETGNLNLIEKGKWYYQEDEHLLIYKKRNSAFFKNNNDGEDIIRYKIKFDYEDSNENGKYEHNIDKFNAVKLQVIDTSL